MIGPVAYCVTHFSRLFEESAVDTCRFPAASSDEPLELEQLRRDPCHAIAGLESSFSSNTSMRYVSMPPQPMDGVYHAASNDPSSTREYNSDWTRVTLVVIS